MFNITFYWIYFKVLLGTSWIQGIYNYSQPFLENEGVSEQLEK